MNHLHPAMAVLLVTPLGHLVGAMVLSVLALGPLGLLAFPVLALFGWFLMLPQFFIVVVQAYFVSRRNFKFGILTVLNLVVLPALLFTLIAPKETGALLGGLGFCNYLIASLSTFFLTLKVLEKIQQDNAVGDKLAQDNSPSNPIQDK